MISLEKNLTKRTALDKGLFDNAFGIASNSKNDEYQRELASRVYRFLDKKSPGKGMKCKNTPNQPSSKLHKPIIKKFKKRKVFSFFMDTIGCARHVYMQLIRR